MTTDTRHDCPGYCGRTVGRNMLACRDCWHRLPHHLQQALTRAEAIRRRNPADTARASAHRHALVACLAWYRANTTKETTAS